jgi:transketolase
MEFRQAIAKKLSELMKEDSSICVLDADLSKPNGTQPLYKEFPDRCFDVGIQEANMVSVAAGLSAYGMKPIVFTFTPFATRRVCDQIAISVCYAKQNVKIVGTDPGLTAELNGGTHMSMEDIGVVRSIPTMAIFDAVDANQLLQAMPQIMNYPGPMYIRTPRKSRPDVFDENYKFQLFKSDVVKEGKDVTLIASGTMVYEAVEASKILNEQNVSCEVISLNMVKPLDEDTLLKSIKKTNHVVVCENHNVVGGVTSAISELLCEKYPCRVEHVGIEDVFGQVGKYDDLLKAYHMTKEDIVKKVLKSLNRD